ncbi:uncharacterized protein LOC132549384 [Ylistrum balloti]|uniref:uncharacterized protein LOC132549384 n=1 Tax=Ylistrum balloti TaxID=509963 RepID=UPI002905B9B3|nr:uncharacterized protein LOC132549384 [Ylistrum balloti]
MEEEQLNQEYKIPLKDSPGPQTCPQFIYSVDDGTLPSNMRTVFLTKVQLTREYQRSRVCLGNCCRRPKDTDDKEKRKKKLWLMCVLVVVITSLITAFVVWELLNKASENQPIYQWDMKEDEDGVLDHEEHESRVLISKTKAIVDKRAFQRTPCRKICWDFSAFKFRSTCMNGFCRCEGHGYNSDTCLPDVDGCVMQSEEVLYADASINGKSVSNYNCKQRSSEGNAIHVFSVFGLGDFSATTIDLKGTNTDDDITIILASYQKMNWIVRVDEGVRIGKIIMMQTLNLGNSDVVIDGLYTGKSPIVSFYRRQSGYGDDRDGGHTVQLIQTITKEVGRITTFTGSKYVDHFSLNLDKISTETA